MLLPRYDIHALHGFLGHPEDWNCLHNVFAYNLFKDFPVVPFGAWASIFNAATKGNSNIFIGYSLGGRLGLHVLLHNQVKWKAAIFISTNPGLKDQAAREKRLMIDKAWAERFLHEPWNDLIRCWNQQDVFKYSVEINRSEADNSRQALAEALTVWSLGMQEDLTEAITNFQMPICWIVGERDKKFMDIAQQLKFNHPKSKLFIIPHAGHRIHLDQPARFKTILTQFIQNLE
jgi:2-succinyl-6-hydroxy-2,4-cyclohexadiene-1-carboxylate synthase